MAYETAWSWKIDGVTVSIAQSFSISISTPGYHTIEYTVTDSNGDTDTYTTSIFVGGMTSVSWLVDGETLGGEVVSKQFTSGGAKSVSCIATDSSNVATKTVEYYISPARVQSATWNIDGVQYAGDSVQHQFDKPNYRTVSMFVADGSSDMDSVSYDFWIGAPEYFNFGDGQYGFGEIVTHVYTFGGVLIAALEFQGVVVAYYEITITDLHGFFTVDNLQHTVKMHILGTIPLSVEIGNARIIMMDVDGDGAQRLGMVAALNSAGDDEAVIKIGSDR